MAPLPPESTRRYFLRYATSLAEHTMMLRTTESVTNSNVSDIWHAILVQWAAELNLITINGLEMAAKGTNVRNPVTWTGNATYGAGAELGFQVPRQICFLGRATDGRRARMFLFGYKGATPNDWRLTSAESAPVAGTYSILTQNPGVFLSISELATVKYTYADVNFNSYWERNHRS